MLLIQFMVWSFYGMKNCVHYVEYLECVVLSRHTRDFSLMWNKLCQMVIFNMHKIWTIHLQCRNLANSLCLTMPKIITNFQPRFFFPVRVMVILSIQSTTIHLSCRKFITISLHCLDIYFLRRLLRQTTKPQMFHTKPNCRCSIFIGYYIPTIFQGKWILHLNNKLTIVKCNCENVEIYLGADRTVCMQVFVTADWIICFFFL